MQRYILKRLLQSIITLFLITLIVFGLTRLTGDPVALMAGPEAAARDVDQIRSSLGLGRPLPVQYLDFVGRAVKGDLGKSFISGESNLSIIKRGLPVTGKLAGGAVLLALILGLLVGTFSALKPGGLMDRFGKTLAIGGQAMPTFLLGILLILIFSVHLRLLPTSGMGGLKYWIMPIATLGWYSTAAQTRLIRSAMLDVLGSEYIKMTRVKGLPEHLVLFKHALRNAALPIVTMTSLQFVALLSGAVIVETIFNLPGIGREVAGAVLTRDFPVVQAIVLLIATTFIVVNLLVDILYAYLDPRIRY